MIKHISITAIILPIVSLGMLMSHSDFLYLIEQRNIVDPCPNGILHAPFGAMTAAGCQATQLFHYPLLGASLLSAIWLSVFLVLRRMVAASPSTECLLAVPPIALLCSVLNVGYWIYCCYMPGHFVSHSLALLSMLLAAWLVDGRGPVVATISAVLLYPLIGMYAVAMGIALVLRKRNNPAWHAAMLATPMLWYAAYSCQCNIGDMYLAGIPIFQTEGYTQAYKSLPVIVAMAATALMLGLCRASIQKTTAAKKYLAYGAVAACLAATWLESIHGNSLEREVRLMRWTEQQQWSMIADDCEKNPKHTQTINALYEHALMRLNRLGSHAFAFYPRRVSNTECDALHINIMHIAAPLLYMEYGMFNNSIRWCNELGCKYGLSLELLRWQAMAAVHNGEAAAASKYTEIIRRLAFHGNWQPASADPTSLELNRGLPDKIGHDYNNIIKCLRNIYTGCPDSAMTDATIQLAAYHAMMNKDSDSFMRIAATGRLPEQRHFQEAYCAMSQGKGTGSVQGSIAASYENLSQMLHELEKTQNQSIITAIRQQYGNTYWWHLYFEK